MRILYFFLAFSFFAFSVQAQYDGSFQVALPVPPDAAALFKTVDRPIGSFTGTVPINIPLYTLSTGGLQVPVSLNYNNGGIRVEEVASWAGLGWNLAAGGQITREMRGVPDENASRRGFITPDPPDSLKPAQFPGTNFGFNTYLVVSGNLDEEPDMFYFSFLGNSGKFYFDTLGTPHMISQQPLLIQKIILNSDSITQFIITDAKGNQFLFGGGYSESSYSTYTSQNGLTNMPTMPSYYSTWHLKQITDMSGEHTINLTYKRTQTDLQTFSSGYMHIGGMTGLDCDAADAYGDQVQVETIAQEYYLTSIQAGNDSLVFYSSSNRPDFPGGFRLDSLRLFEKGGIIREGFHLNTSFFNYSGGSYNVYTNRLALNNLSEFGAGSRDSLLYQFTYNTSVSLPSRISYGMDYWGYYNGNDFNTSLLPNNVYANGINIIPVTNLGDRRSNGHYGAAFTMTRITYPTGGYRTFDYEGNQALLEFGSQVMPDANYFQTVPLNGTGLTYKGTGQPIFSDTFTVNSANNAVPFTFNLTGSGSGNYSVALYQVLGVTTTLLFTFNKALAGSYEIIGNGSFKVVVTEDAACNFTAIHCSWSQLVMTTTYASRYGAIDRAQNNNVGGIRVSAVHDYDPVSGNTLTTRFKYYLPSDTLLTSGVMITPMQVAHIGACPTRNCQYIRLTATSQYPMATEGGSYVVYPNVRTIVDGKGYTDREYSFAFDQTPQGWDAMNAYPIVPPTDNSGARGQLVVERNYDNNGELLRHTASMGQGIYSSEWGPPGPFKPQDYLMSDQIALKVIGYFQCYTGPNLPTVLCEACWGQYDLESLFMGMLSTQSTDYQPDGGKIIRQTDFSYWTNEGYPLLKTKTEYLYNGDTVRTHYCYAFNNPTDFVLGLTSTQNTWTTLLQSIHYQQPIEITTTKTPAGSFLPAFVQGVKYSFNYFNGSKPHLASQITYTSKTDSVTLNLSGYDSYGNLTEQYKSGDKREVLLWGYNGQYPVARVTGSDYATVSSLVNNATIQNPASDQVLRNEIGKIRTGLSSGSAQVTTYTYAPGLGITSQTDPAGTTLYYNYDPYGRLMLMMDMHNNIIKKFDYHFQGQ